MTRPSFDPESFDLHSSINDEEETTVTQVYVDSVLGSSRFHLKIYFKPRGTVFCSALTSLMTKNSLSLELHILGTAIK